MNDQRVRLYETGNELRQEKIYLILSGFFHTNDVFLIGVSWMKVKHKKKRTTHV